MAQSSLERLHISTTAFWSVDFEKIDFEGDSLFVMDKALNYGTWPDKMNS